MLTTEQKVAKYVREAAFALDRCTPDNPSLTHWLDAADTAIKKASIVAYQASAKEVRSREGAEAIDIAYATRLRNRAKNLRSQLPPGTRI